MNVSSGYFDVLRIPIVAGRNFAPDQTEARFVVVNQRFAALLWPGQDPIGKRFLSRYKDPVEREVIGVAKDVFTENVGVIEPMFYAIFGGALEPKLLMRTTDTAALARISGVVAALDARARVRLIPLASNFGDEIAMSRRTAVMAGAFGSLALTLSASECSASSHTWCSSGPARSASGWRSARSLATWCVSCWRATRGPS